MLNTKKDINYKRNYTYEKKNALVDVLSVYMICLLFFQYTLKIGQDFVDILCDWTILYSTKFIIHRLNGELLFFPLVFPTDSKYKGLWSELRIRIHFFLEVGPDPFFFIL